MQRDSPRRDKGQHQRPDRWTSETPAAEIINLRISLEGLTETIEADPDALQAQKKSFRAHQFELDWTIRYAIDYNWIALYVPFLSVIRTPLALYLWNGSALRKGSSLVSSNCSLLNCIETSKIFHTRSHMVVQHQLQNKSNLFNCQMLCSEVSDERPQVL